MASPFFDLAQLWQQGQQQQQNNAYRNALLQLDRQNQQLKARQVLQGLAAQKLIGSLSGAIAQPGGGSLGAGPQPQPPPLNMTPMPSGGGLPSSFPQVPNAGAQMADNSAALGLIARDESGGRNIPNYRFDAGHTASGPLQITDTTWNRYAPSVGAPPLQYPASPKDRPVSEQYKVGGAIFNKEGFAPWANFNPKLAADLKLSPEAQQQSSQVAVGAAGMLPPQMVGRGTPDIFARLVDRVAGSDAPDEVKGAALMQLLPLMSKEGQQSFQQAFEMYRLGAEQSEKGREFGIRQSELEETRKQNADFRQQMIDIQRGRLQVTQDKAAQAQAQQQQFSEGDVDYWAKVLKSGGHLPPGLARTAAGSQFVQRVMAKIPGMSGGDPGSFIENASTVKADDRSLSNMTKMADAATSFERTANMNFDTALRLSKDAVPTDWGPWLNKFIETGETQAGNTEIPPYVTAMLTAANEYAKIMSGSTGAQGSTVDSRREAAELFSPYLSAGQIDRVVAIAKNDMANRKQSLYGQIDDIKARLHSAGSGQPTATQGQQTQPTSTKYTVGQIIEKGGKRYRVTGGDLANDPDVEPAQ